MSSPLEPGNGLVLRELGPLLAEEHVVGSEVAPRLQVLGSQLETVHQVAEHLQPLTHPVHGTVVHIEDDRLLSLTQLQVRLGDAEIPQLSLQLSLVGEPGLVLPLPPLDLRDEIWKVGVVLLISVSRGNLRHTPRPTGRAPEECLCQCRTVFSALEPPHQVQSKYPSKY